MSARWASSVLAIAVAVAMVIGEDAAGADAVSDSQQAQQGEPTRLQDKSQTGEPAPQAAVEPDRPLNALAFALAKRARETSDASFYDRAMQAVEASQRLNPGNIGAEKARVWILLGKHRFPEAFEAAEALLKRAPQDPLVLAVMTDACVELGMYDRAERTAQAMLDLTPGTSPALTRSAYLREIFGDIDGALELLGSAMRNLRTGDAEDHAWMLVQAAHLELSRGRIESAETLLNKAMALVPNYHYAMAQLAQVRMAEEKHAEAAELLQRHVKAAPHAANFYYLADALRLAHREQEANDAFATFEEKARVQIDTRDNANRELIFYYADRVENAPEALRIARMEIAWRKDVYTLGAYAWALHKNGQDDEADTQITAALAVGVQDAVIFYRAGVIREALGKHADAARFFNDSLNLNPKSQAAAAARTAAASRGSGVGRPEVAKPGN